MEMAIVELFMKAKDFEEIRKAIEDFKASYNHSKG